MTPEWVIDDVQLAGEPREIPADGRAHFLVFWWGGLPLGLKVLLPEELPFRRPEITAIAAEYLADQASARRYAGTPLRHAGVDGVPREGLRRVQAVQPDSVLAHLDGIATRPPPPHARQLSVVICTRDRPEMLRACLAGLQRQAAPPGEVIVVDNSADAGARGVCGGLANVIYVHEPRPGLSRARNAGLAAAGGEIIAFTDDDVALPPHWTQEIVRAFADHAVDAVTGLVLPAELDTPAQRVFQLDLGGFMSRFTPLIFDHRFLDETRHMGPQVWRIGAGANMAFRRSMVARVGGFDERLGAGAAGCSEDSEYWYRILAAGGVCLYEPRLWVRHHHRADWPGLRRQLRAYMKGHAAALVAQADRYGDRGNIRRLLVALPAYHLWTAMTSVQKTAWWRLDLLWCEFLGWAEGLPYLLRRSWRRQVAPPAIGLRPVAEEGEVRSVA